MDENNNGYDNGQNNKAENQALSEFEKQKIRAKMRLDMARIKAHKQAERDKQRATELRERNRRKDERREMRLIAKNKRKQKRQDQVKSSGYVTAVIVLSLCVVVLGVFLSFKLFLPTTESKLLEASYQRSFYDTMEQVDNMDVNLSKALGSKDKGALQTYLVDTAINSELCESDLQQLPLEDQSKFYTTKLVNQIGDYSKYLNKKLSNGENLTKEDYDNLYALYKANLQLKNSLQQTFSQMDNDYAFSDITEGQSGNLVVENFNELQNLSASYPELIYDGPFSDGLDRKDVRGLTGNDVTGEQAIEYARSVFGNYGINGIKNEGETSGIIDCYNINIDSRKGRIFAQISKTGGKLIMFSSEGTCSATNYGEDYIIETATGFLADIGLFEMQPVWVNLANNVYTVNYAYEDGGVIVYSDLIKIRVCAETNTVIGLEASEYYINHIERNIQSPRLTSYQAQEYVSDNINVENGRLAVVPIGNSDESLCYEFYGTFDDSVYYVYIDASNGKQVQMFKVIESTEGKLLI